MNLSYSVLFFILLSILVPLGEGLQIMVDSVAAAGILCFYVGSLVFGKKIHNPPWKINIAWLSVFAYLVTRAIFSDSVGYSISFIARYVMAYLTFVLFSSGFTDSKSYSRSLLWFVGVCIVASWLVSVVPAAQYWFPGMNLLYPTYGHNHVAALVIFILPLVFNRFVSKKNVINGTLLLFVAIALIVSFARGAVPIALGYLFYRVLVSRKNDRKKYFVLALLMAGCFISVVFIQTAPKILTKEVAGNSVLERQIIKSSPVENRVYYWNQAIAAIEARPHFGAGPGTFSLLSKRYQPESGRYSWYAHSYPLELLAEVGIFGFAGIVTVFLYSMSSFVKNMKAPRVQDETSLASGVFLTLLYSIYEVNLNFIVVWLLIWATIGVLSSKFNTKKLLDQGVGYFSVLRAVCVSALVLYYVFSFGAAGARVFVKNPWYAVVFEPHIAERVRAYIISQGGTSSLREYQIDLFVWFHRKNPEILYELANNQQKMSAIKRRDYYQQAISADKTNIDYWKSYLQFESGESTDNYQKAVSLFITEYGSAEFRMAIPTPSMEEITYLIDYLNRNTVFASNDQRNNFVRLFYGLGLADISTHPTKTRTWWTLARDSNPNWSYTHIELAALENHAFQNVNGSQELLEYCQRYAYASEHCRSIKLSNLPQPGAFKTNIYAVPDVIN